MTTQSLAIITRALVGRKAAQVDVDALAATVAAAIPLGTFSVATLPAPTAAIVGRLAKVTDLFGDQFDTVRCCAVGSFYFWKPQSSDSARNYTLTGDMTVKPLTYPQGLRLNGSIGVSVLRKVTLDVEGGWPGCCKEISAGGLGTILGTLNVLGTGLGSGVGLLTGNYKKFMLDYSGGALAWIQIV